VKRVGADSAGMYIDRGSGDVVVNVVDAADTRTVEAAGAEAKVVEHSMSELEAARDTLTKARDMAYTIGWSVFALAMLIAGISSRTRAARYAALALLGAAVLKLFFHDLAQLNQLYRIGALVAVAVVAIVSSWLYQRFLRADEAKAE
jgi:uncharacterized membrane protein